MSAGKRAARRSERSGGRSFAQWSVRRKVAAVLVVPLLATVALGTVSGVGKFRAAQHEAAVAKNIDTVSPVLEVSVANATLAFLQGSGIQDPVGINEAVNNLRKRIEDVEYLESDPDVPAGQENFAKILAAARDTLAQGKTPEPSLQKVKERADNSRLTMMKYMEAVIFTVSETVSEAKFRLVDAQNCNGTMILEAVGMLAIGRGEKDGLATFVTGLNGERLMLEVLARRYPENDPVVTDLNLGINNRIRLAGQPGNFPAFEALASFQDSNNTYVSIVNKSVGTIRDAAHAKARETRNEAIGYGVAVGLIALLALVLAAIVGQAITGPLRRLRFAALDVADRRLPQAVDELKDGASLAEVQLPSMPVHTDEEVGQLARAVDSMQGQALRLAGEQAQLRVQVNDMFETLARRNRSLIDHQLSVLDSLESAPVDPALQERLFRLDHLAARMRRNAENLLILAGTQVRRAHTAPVAIADVMWAAVSEVENYQQIELAPAPPGYLLEPAATDIAHVFAELLDNAVRASPPDAPVRITFGRAADHGLLIEVADHGIGIPPAELDLINERFNTSAEVDASTARHMGLYVVGRLAERHGLAVTLRPTVPSPRSPGVTVAVRVPPALLTGSAPSRGAPLPMSPPPMSPPSMGSPPVTSPASPPPPRPATPTVSWTPQGTMIATINPGISSKAEGPQRDSGPGSAPAGTPPRWSPPLAPPAGQPEAQQRGLPPLPQRTISGPRPGPPLPARTPATPSARPEREDPAPGAPLRTDDTAETPIFAGLVTGWLGEPAENEPGAFASPADAGWAAAAGGTGQPDRTTAGLPQRRPGERLIPGTASQAGRHRQRRDPDSVRQSLGNYQQGVRTGRAARHRQPDQPG